MAMGRDDKAELAPLVEAMRRADFDSAIAGLKTYLERYPGHEVALGMFAAAYFQIGLKDRAQPLYEELLRHHPENALARFQLGLLHLANDPGTALEIWDPLLQVEEEFMAHFHAALAHLQLRQAERALPLLEHAGRYMPGGHPLQAQLQELRASIARDLGGTSHG